jgi:hypothetical protein
MRVMLLYFTSLIFYSYSLLIDIPLIHSSVKEPIYIDFDIIQGKYTLTTLFGEHHKNTTALISLQTPFSFFSFKSFNLNIHDLLQPNSITLIKNNLYFFDVYRSVFQIPTINVEITNFIFYLLNKSNKNFPKNNEISFALNSKYFNNSLIYRLYHQNIIDKPSFTLHQVATLKGKMTFGSYDSKSYKNIATCKTNSTLNGWNCLMKSIINVNSSLKDEYIYNNQVLFDSTISKSIFTCEFILFIKIKILNKEFENGNCYFIENEKKIKIECKEFVPN